MKILWLTPFSARSAIGVFSREICDEMAKRGHCIRIMRVESGAESHLPTLATSIDIMGPDESVPNDVDVIVINYGNHAPYHAGTLRVAAQHPHLAIFHDAEMRHFQWGMVDRHGIAFPDICNDQRPQDRLGSNPDLIDQAALPVLEMLSAMCIGAVVHGPHYEATVSEACPGPVKMIPLCFPVTGNSNTQMHGQWASSLTYRVTIFGIISPYKQPERLMRAVSALKREDLPIEIHLAGAIEDHFREQLKELARELDIPEPIFHGYLSDDDLAAILRASDVICCLRHPVTEGGSASLITAMYQGRPLIVSDVASYSTVPDEFVSKVSYGDEPGDLADALRKILMKPQEAAAAALRGRDWAIINYSAKVYVDRLEPLLHDIIEELPVQKAIRQLSAKTVTPDGMVMHGALISMARAAKELFSENKI